MKLAAAEQYLNEVIERRRCIPFTKYNGSMGRTGQALQFGLTKGRWPVKSCRIMLGILQNARANAEQKRLNVDNLVIKRVSVNAAVQGRRRTYRAHGRINAYLSSNCHVEVICEEYRKPVKQPRKEEKKTKGVFAFRQIRKSLARKYKEQKYVLVGKKSNEEKK